VSAPASLIPILIILGGGFVWFTWRMRMRDSDEWYVASLIVVSGFLIGIFTIPDADFAFYLKIDTDVVIGITYFIASLAYFTLIRRHLAEPPEKPAKMEVEFKYPEPQKANLDVQALKHYKGYALPDKIEILPDLSDGQHQFKGTSMGASTPLEEYGRLSQSQKLEVHQYTVDSTSKSAIIKELIAKFGVVRVYCISGDVSECRAEVKYRIAEIYGRPRSSPMVYGGVLNWFDLNAKRDIQNNMESVLQERGQGINKYLHNATETLHEGDERDLLVFYMIKDIPSVFLCSDVLGQGSNLGTLPQGQRIKFELEISLAGQGYPKTIWHFLATVHEWDDFALQRI
jgi:hypothetical protein